MSFDALVAAIDWFPVRVRFVRALVLGTGSVPPPQVTASAGTSARITALASASTRTERAMYGNGESNGKLGAILGALVAMALVLFLLGGGEHFGKKTVNSDEDLPPVATSKQ
jgi:hypothetical protein